MRILGLEVRRAPNLVAAAELRSAVTPSMSAQDFYAGLGINWSNSAAGIPVTIDTALGIPAVFAAVNFIASTIAGLPLHLYERSSAGRKRISEGPLAAMLHDAVNDDMSSFDWRKLKFTSVLTGGRGLSWIERGANKVPVNLWPLDPQGVTIRRKDGRVTYAYRDGASRTVTYDAVDVIDIAFMLKGDGLNHRGPIQTCRDTLALAIAATQFGSKFFQNGGVPPFAVTGNFQSGQAMQRAADDLAEATRMAARESRQALVLPQGLEIKPLGADAEKSQLVELKKFLITEIARTWSLPPVFLQDLTHGTFTNTEQQDLQLTKHTLKRWVEQTEQEMNLKLFGRGNRQFYVEFAMDGLLRGDFKTRMEGYAQGIQHGVLVPGEARDMENRPRLPGDDKLYMQGAMLPIDDLGKDRKTSAKGDANGA